MDDIEEHSELFLDEEIINGLDQTSASSLNTKYLDDQD
jgi:hypothetical protein